MSFFLAKKKLDDFVCLCVCAWCFYHRDDDYDHDDGSSSSIIVVVVNND